VFDVSVSMDLIMLRGPLLVLGLTSVCPLLGGTAKQSFDLGMRRQLTSLFPAGPLVIMQICSRWYERFANKYIVLEKPVASFGV